MTFYNTIRDCGAVIRATLEMFVSTPYFGLAVIALVIGIIKRCSYR